MSRRSPQKYSKLSLEDECGFALQQLPFLGLPLPFNCILNCRSRTFHCPPSTIHYRDPAAFSLTFPLSFSPPSVTHTARTTMALDRPHCPVGTRLGQPSARLPFCCPPSPFVGHFNGDSKRGCQQNESLADGYDQAGMISKWTYEWVFPLLQVRSSPAARTASPRAGGRFVLLPLQPRAAGLPPRCSVRSCSTSVPSAPEPAVCLVLILRTSTRRADVAPAATLALSMLAADRADSSCAAAIGSSATRNMWQA